MTFKSEEFFHELDTISKIIAEKTKKKLRFVENICMLDKNRKINDIFF